MRYFVFALPILLLSCGIADEPADAGPDTRVRRDFKVVEFSMPEWQKLDAGRARCGDHICNGNETWRSCWVDCTPQQWNLNPPRDPGWIDPVNNVCYKKVSVYFWTL